MSGAFYDRLSDISATVIFSRLGRSVGHGHGHKPRRTEAVLDTTRFNGLRMSCGGETKGRDLSKKLRPEVRQIAACTWPPESCIGAGYGGASQKLSNHNAAPGLTAAKILMAEIATFDHYEVLTRPDGSLFELGRGGMGITYKAFDTNLRMTVALKVINATYLQSELAQQRFIREARSAAKLRNRHVASVFHLATKGDMWFYAMEFIDGETLGALIKRQGSLDPVFALKVTAQVARALNAAAQHGLVHRDIKPDNLMLVEDDDELVVKVIDFGLAKAAVANDEDALMVSMGGFVGTAHFASPEQWQEKEIDTRSDIYSLGVTLWYMLTGQAPFSGSMPQVMTKHLSAPPPFEKLGNVPPGVTDLLRKMLAKDPGDRFQKPAELRKAIEALLNTHGRGNGVGRAESGRDRAPGRIGNGRAARRTADPVARGQFRDQLDDRESLPGRPLLRRDERRARLSRLRYPAQNGGASHRPPPRDARRQHGADPDRADRGKSRPRRSS